MALPLEDNFLEQLAVDAPPAIVALVVPGVLMYLSLWLLAKRWLRVSRLLAVLTLGLFWISPDTAPVRCAAFRALLNFGVAVGTLKLLDIHMLSLTKSFPTYTYNHPPRPSVMAVILLTELRWESFSPNPIRLPPTPNHPFSTSPSKKAIFYSEPFQLLIHIGLFTVLQSLPQYAPVKALGILLTIWIIWTSIQVVVRYRTSPPLFGPIYLADSLATFWTETWHNAFAAPCFSLAYTPTCSVLSHIFPFLPRSVYRSVGIVASFGLMGLFHVYALAPLLRDEGKFRMGAFFVGNGVMTVAEVAVWGKDRHWVKTVLAWTLELAIASWTVDAAEIADGVLGADWRGLCRSRV